MVLFKVVLSICCLISIIVIGYFTIGYNRSCLTNHTPVGWWIIGIGIVQLFAITMFALWWEEWWMTHAMIIRISVWIAVISGILWAVVETGRRR